MNQMVGNGSLCFSKTPFFISTASVVGKKEGEGPLGDLFDVVLEDDMNGCSSWEEAESTLQRDAVSTLLQKTEVRSENIRYLFGGDLLGQSIASTFGLLSFEIPYVGLYGACSTMGEAMSLAAITVSCGCADNVIALASSHFASAEKQFRFPLEYANQRPKSATWTVTGSGAFLLMCAEMNLL